ncbi:MAG TPA: hypothetical protein VG965_04645 [Patescibacteria group bacterium]|nr:hypothetical protein [Patescibacteria group bacterium]
MPKTLKEILEEIRTKSEAVSHKAGEIQRTGNFIKEFAEVSIAGYDDSPLNDQPAIYIGDFQKILDNLGKVEVHLDTMASLASGASFGTASVMTTLSGMMTPNSYRSNPSYAPFYVQFDQVIDRGQTKDQALAEITRLGLDTTTEGKEAVGLLNAAWNLHTQGAGISTSTLIPLREAIEKTLQAIRVKTPQQSKLKKWIIDLGSKVCFSTISATDLQSLQAEHELLRDKLSGSKSGTYSREEEKILLREGTLHLLKILNIIDATKLR